MTLYVCYNANCKNLVDSLHELTKTFPLLEIKAFDEEHYKERKQSFRIKGGYSAKELPFALLTDNENKCMHAFYSEDKSCTLENINRILNSFVPYGNDKLNIVYESTSY